MSTSRPADQVTGGGGAAQATGGTPFGGAGHAGLAVGRCLAEHGADHVVVERGRIAERWRTARWESLRLITPNWMSQLPAWSYPGTDPDGYLAAPELVSYLEGYAGSVPAPVHRDTDV